MLLGGPRRGPRAVHFGDWLEPEHMDDVLFNCVCLRVPPNRMGDRGDPRLERITDISPEQASQLLPVSMFSFTKSQQSRNTGQMKLKKVVPVRYVLAESSLLPPGEPCITANAAKGSFCVALHLCDTKED